MRNYQFIHHREKRKLYKEAPEEEETVIPTTKAKAKSKFKEPNEPKNNNREIVKSLEATE